jgi:uncharacterized protein YgiM (DUF1202 family)
MRMKIALLVLAVSILACGTYAVPAATTPPPDTATVSPITKTAVIPSKTPASIDTGTPEIVTVSATHALHVRVRPGEQNAVIGYLYHTDVVQLSGKCQTGWAQIIWQDGTAWVNSKFLSTNSCQTNESE